MSFGIGVGDLITTLRLAEEVRKRFVDAPDEYQIVRKQVRNLSIVVGDIDDLLPHRDLQKQREKELQTVRDDCLNVLGELNQELDKYSNLGGNSKGRRDSLRDCWKRVHWDQKKIDAFRERITFSLAGFKTFLQCLNSDTIFEIKDGVDRLNAREEHREENEKRKAILDWFSTVNYVSQQQDIIAKRQKGTGSWLVQSNEFKTWMARPKSTMLCHGIPGAGKTIMSGIIISHLQEMFQDDPTIGVAYIYFNYQAHQEQSLEAVLGCLLRQILQTRDPLPTGIQDLYEKHARASTRISSEELETAFQAVTRPYSRVFVVLDALDEYYSSDSSGFTKFIHGLCHLQQMSPLNVIATCRPIFSIMTMFKDHIEKEIRAQEDDVSVYIDARMAELLHGRIYSDMNKHMLPMVKSAVIEATDGMFLLARLHMDALKGSPVPGYLRRALQNLPKGTDGINTTYDQAMERIEMQSEETRSLAKRILKWAIHAERPLSVDEILDAVAIEPGSADLEMDLRPEQEDLDSLCAGLITVDRNSKVVRLVHYTAQEYFEQRKLFPEAHSEILEACTTYLAFDKFPSVLRETPVDEFPLYAYAAVHWHFHARFAIPAPEQTLHFLKNCPQQVSASWVVCRETRRGFFVSTRPMWEERSSQIPALDSICGIHLAAWLCLPLLVEQLIEIGVAVETEDKVGRTPLIHTAHNNGEETAKILLEKFHANPNCMGGLGFTPLKIAASHNFYGLARLLMADPRTDPNLQQLTPPPKRDIVYLDARSPLSHAACGGNLDIVKMLLASPKLDIAAIDPWGQTVLSHLLFLQFRQKRDGRADCIRLILEDSRLTCNPLWESAPKDLATAVILGFEVSVHKLLLKNKDMVNRKDDDGCTVLSHAVQAGLLEFSKRLLTEHTADPDVRDYDRCTPLHHAAESRNKDVVALLLNEYGVDPHPESKTGETPIQKALVARCVETVEVFLLKFGIASTRKNICAKGLVPNEVQETDVQELETLPLDAADITDERWTAVLSKFGIAPVQKNKERPRFVMTMELPENPFDTTAITDEKWATIAERLHCKKWEEQSKQRLMETPHILYRILLSTEEEGSPEGSRKGECSETVEE